MLSPNERRKLGIVKEQFKDFERGKRERKDYYVATWIVLAVLIGLVLWFSYAFGYEVILTRELPLSENIAEDFKNASLEMLYEHQKHGCKTIRIAAWTSPDKPRILQVMAECVETIPARKQEKGMPILRINWHTIMNQSLCYFCKSKELYLNAAVCRNCYRSLLEERRDVRYLAEQARKDEQYWLGDNLFATSSKMV